MDFTTQHSVLTVLFMWVLCSFAVSFVASNFGLIIGVSLYDHRFMSHNSIQILSQKLLWFCRYVAWQFTWMIPEEFARTHIKHHICADQDDDPYSPNAPKGSSVWRILFLNGWVYHKKKRAADILAGQYDQPWFPKPDGWTPLFNSKLAGMTAMWLVYFVIFSVLFLLVYGFGPVLLLAAVLAGLSLVFHIVGILLGGGAVNALNHDPIGLRLKAIWRTSWARDAFSGLTWNRIWLALITAGEGWHNNHHRFQGNYRFGPRFDIAAWVAERIEWFGRVVLHRKLLVLNMVKPMNEIMSELRAQKAEMALMTKAMLRKKRDSLKKFPELDLAA